MPAQPGIVIGMTSDPPALDTRRPFTRADALAAGIAPAALRGSRFRRIFRGVYVDAAVADTALLRVEAALAIAPRRDGAGVVAFASHASAARVYDAPIPTLPDEHISVLDPEHRRSREGVVCHVCPAPDLRRVRGLPVSSPAQLFSELATRLSLVDLVVVGENLVRCRWITVPELVAHCGASTAPGASYARRAATYVRERVDSPMETRLRMLLVLSGLPEPEINRKIRAADGEVLRRYDLSWPAVKVIVEYDGRQHIERVENWEADIDRREGIDDDGWRILVVTSRGIYREPGRTVERVWRVLRSRGLAGMPSRPSGAWRPHFPGYSSAA